MHWQWRMRSADCSKTRPALGIWAFRVVSERWSTLRSNEVLRSSWTCASESSVEPLHPHSIRLLTRVSKSSPLERRWGVIQRMTKIPETEQAIAGFVPGCIGGRPFPVFAPLLIFAAMGCCAIRLSATTFYVDCDHGKDSARGHSLKATWQHLDAVNSFALKQGFHPGDSILLKRGCRWHEQLELLNNNKSGPLTNSGKDGELIAIFAYGIGDLPTIDGADTATGWKPR